MNKPLPPCFRCPDRTEDCHKSGHCEKYADYVKKAEQYREEQAGKYIIWEYTNDRSRRKKK